MRFTHGQLSFEVSCFGHGPVPLLAFHGFGRTGQDFAVFEQALGERYTIHAFDLPFHGQSPSPSKRAQQPFEPAELRDYFTAFVDRIGAERVHLIGYSLGGRVALSLLETMPERIERAYLLAPDGLKTKPWYRGLASSAWGRARYRRFIEYPRRVHAVMNLLHRIGAINAKMHRFLLRQSDTSAKRKLLHDVWLSFRHIEPDLSTVAAHLRTRNIPLTLVFGAKDSVIKPLLAANLRPLAPDHVHVLIVDAGHQLLTNETAEVLASLGPK